MKINGAISTPSLCSNEQRTQAVNSEHNTNSRSSWTDCDEWVSHHTWNEEELVPMFLCKYKLNSTTAVMWQLNHTTLQARMPRLCVKGALILQFNQLHLVNFVTYIIIIQLSTLKQYISKFLLSSSPNFTNIWICQNFQFHNLTYFHISWNVQQC